MMTGQYIAAASPPSFEHAIDYEKKAACKVNDPDFPQILQHKTCNNEGGA
ncbi:hypothetical protein ACF3N7_09675 [Cruoricaptor ignavus]